MLENTGALACTAFRLEADFRRMNKAPRQAVKATLEAFVTAIYGIECHAILHAGAIMHFFPLV